MDKKIINMVLPKGFKAAGIHCGLKKKRKDLAVFYSDKLCNVAAAFTRNLVKAAPVVLCQETLKKSDSIQAVLVNSGNANCMTGKQGYQDAVKMQKTAAKSLGLKSHEVLISSTGVIGRPMDMKPLMEGIPVVVDKLSYDGLSQAAEAIMTTDQFVKVSSRTFLCAGENVIISGTGKGAGMIRPDMATMLCYIMTDANISKKMLKKVLIDVNNDTFNSITVDGDMSTNDTLILMSNGLAGNKLIKDAGTDYKIFQDNLKQVMMDLAKMIVSDGEGATKLIEITIVGAKNSSDAEKAASSIANSTLMKCAVHGGDPNWGRVAAACGSSGAKFDPEIMDIKMDNVMFYSKGKVIKNTKEQKQNVFKNKEVSIDVDFHCGTGKSKKYSCDLSKKYIAINAFYTT
ncbi:MAG: bifunctional glutamate N-acetyltransferase/amino-acid acetyltransferase ArgJ [Candidatus Omnitrophica bacterium]|nr:bifunctional glutamate N-acetyltransferase/amino-acid acetyltransferase ArgJ [Candidatus Omnitrophota bacterium]